MTDNELLDKLAKMGLGPRAGRVVTPEQRADLAEREAQRLRAENARLRVAAVRCCEVLEHELNPMTDAAQAVRDLREALSGTSAGF